MIEGKRAPVPLAFSEDGSTVWEEAFDFGPTSCLVEHRLDRQQRRALACDKHADLVDVHRSFDRARMPLAAVFAAGKPELQYVSEPSPQREQWEQLQAAFPGQRVVPYSTSRDGSRALLYVYSDRSPGDYFLFDATTNKADFFAAAAEWLDPDLMSERRPFSLAARDGQMLWGYLTLPRGRAETGLPMVVLPHGGPFGVRDRWVFDRQSQLLASRGYAVLQVNFRGSHGYGGAFVDAGKKAWGTTMINDITDAVRRSIAKGHADPGRICVYGGSYGAYAAMMSAIREPALYRCVIAAFGVYDLPLLKQQSDIADTDRGLEYLDEAIGSSREEQIAQSPVSHLARLKAPVLIIHGADDKRTPLSQAKSLRRELKRLELPYEWLVKEDEGHGFRDPASKHEMYTRVLAFLDRHLAAATTATADAAQ